jgi:hypothetical protein
VFDALCAGPFLPMPDDRHRAANLRQHFTEVCRRFLYSLQHLNELMQQMADNFGAGLPDSMRVQLEAGCQADHALTYLNTIVDDIAQAIVLATRVTRPNSKQRMESMGDLKHPDVIKLPALAPVRMLLDELNKPSTWWELAFKPRQGARQLLIHNQYVVTFQGAQAPGEPMKAEAYLMSADQNRPIAGDFFTLLRDILTSLCDWLDRLEGTLVTHLQTLNSSWKPSSQCPYILLGLGFPMSGVNYHPLYFPLPLCDGADPLPWVIGPPVYEGATPTE